MGMCIAEGKSRRAQEESRGQEEGGDTRERVIPRYYAEGKSKVGELKTGCDSFYAAIGA